MPQLLSLTNDSDENVILRFNKTRIPGSKESKDVQEFIINYFEKLDHEWLVDQDSFEENGFSFTNLVFSSTIAEKYIVFAVHYDSKIEPEGFIGAMDSAASCGILLYLARFIDNVYSLEQNLIDRTISAEYVGIKIVFFDGEEALKEWGPNDSIYGAKHLASKWDQKNILDTIDLFVLMDLIGSDEHVTIPSFFRGSHFYYEMLSELEDSYLETRSKGTKSLVPTDHRFLELGRGVIDDDHIPFYNAGIDVLHLIPLPFPQTWHTIHDTFDHLGQEEIYKWAELISNFVINVVDLYRL